MDIIIRDVEEIDGQYKIINKDGTGGHWYISKESAEIVGQIEPLVMPKITEAIELVKWRLKGITAMKTRNINDDHEKAIISKIGDIQLDVCDAVLEEIQRNFTA